VGSATGASPIAMAGPDMTMALPAGLSTVQAAARATNAQGVGEPSEAVTLRGSSPLGQGSASEATALYDAQDVLHVAFVDAGNGALRYGRLTAAGSWSQWQVDANRSAQPAMAIDGGGQLHIAYRRASSKDLRYALGRANSWTLSNVESSNDVGYNPAIALDPAGKPWIIHQDATNSTLRLARWDGDSWVRSALPSSSNSCRSRLAFFPDGLPIYVTDYSRGVHVRTGDADGTHWTSTRLPGDYFYGCSARVALFLAGDVPHVAYTLTNEPHDHFLHHAYRPSGQSGWITGEPVEVDGGELVAASDGRGGAYFVAGSSSGTLLHARADGTLADLATGYGLWPQALVASGEQGLLVLGPSNEQLKLARFWMR